jgi:hypothetical protein
MKKDQARNRNPEFIPIANSTISDREQISHTRIADCLCLPNAIKAVVVRDKMLREMAASTKGKRNELAAMYSTPKMNDIIQSGIRITKGNASDTRPKTTIIPDRKALTLFSYPITLLDESSGKITLFTVDKSANAIAPIVITD